MNDTNLDMIEARLDWLADEIVALSLLVNKVLRLLSEKEPQ